MNRIYLVCILFLALLAGCTKPAKKTYEITKVEMARSGAWSDFGATIRVDSSLNYDYWGDYNNIKQGFFSGKVSKAFWDTLNQKIGKTQFKSIDTMTNLGVKDAEYYELIVHWKGGKRRILRVDNSNTDAILSFCRWMDTTYKFIKLRRLSVNISSTFETHFHNSYRLTIDQVKFPPPEKLK